MTFEEKIGPSNVNHKIYKLVLYLICNDWKQIIRPEAPSSMTFEEKIGPSNVNHKIYKLVLYLICNDWKQILRLEAPSKIILKTFYYKNKGTRKIKEFPKPSI